MKRVSIVWKWMVVSLFLFLLSACGTSSVNTNGDSDQLPDEGEDNSLQDDDIQIIPDQTTDTDVVQHLDDEANNDETIDDVDNTDTDTAINDENNDEPFVFDEDFSDDSDMNCYDLPTPDPVRLAPMEALETPFPVQFTTNDGYNDHYLFGKGPNSTVVKIGIREEWGGSIIFYGLNYGNAGTNDSNTIDSNDTGREIQIAIYDPDRIVQGCAYNASCRSGGTACSGGITFLGWNPVQGGNECNIGSGTESVVAGEKMLESTTVPLFWNPDWDLNSCDNGGCGNDTLKSRKSDIRYHQELRFVDLNVVEMSMTIENLSNVDHAPRAQEYPTIYTGYGEHGLQNYNTLLDSNKNVIAIDEPANDGFFKKDFSSPDGWVSLQNAKKDYGIGIYNENKQTEYEGWQKAGTFNNVRASFVFGLPAFGKVVARAYLILGDIDTVAQLAEKLDTSLAPFGSMDTPTADEHLSGSVNVGGWTLDNKGVSTVRILLNGKVIDTADLTLQRNDVCSVFPGYSMCKGNNGFTKTVSLNGIKPCAYILEVEVEDSDGNRRVIDRKRVFID